MGLLWLDVVGCELSVEDKDIFEYLMVGGVILFVCNYYDNQ